MPGSEGCTMLAGQVITGSSLSVMVMVNEQVDTLPLASVTWNVFVVEPIGKVDPDGKPEVCIITNPGQLSDTFTI